MSLQSVRQFFAEHAPDIEIIELNQSTATVALAAAAHNVEPGQIAKTLSLKIKDKIVLIVARGDAAFARLVWKIRWQSTATSLSDIIRKYYPQREPSIARVALNQNAWRSSPMQHG